MARPKPLLDDDFLVTYTKTNKKTRAVSNEVRVVKNRIATKKLARLDEPMGKLQYTYKIQRQTNVSSEHRKKVANLKKEHFREVSGNLLMITILRQLAHTKSLRLLI